MNKLIKDAVKLIESTYVNFRRAQDALAIALKMGGFVYGAKVRTKNTGETGFIYSVKVNYDRAIITIRHPSKAGDGPGGKCIGGYWQYDEIEIIENKGE